MTTEGRLGGRERGGGADFHQGGVEGGGEGVIPPSYKTEIKGCKEKYQEFDGE